MPGASAGRVRGAGPINVPRVRVQSQAPGVMKRAGGVLVNGDALAAGEMGVARAEARKGAAVVGAINDVGEGISNVLKRVVLARESAELMEADAAMTAGFETYRAQLPEDPSDWEEGWSEKLSEIRETVFGEGKQSLALKNKLEKNLEAFQAETSTRLSTMAIQQNARLAKVKSNHALDQAVEYGDMAKARDIIAHMQEAGIAAPEQAEVMLDRAQRTIYRNQWEGLKVADPWTAQKLLDEGGTPFLTPAEAAKERGSVRYYQQQKRAEQAHSIAEGLEAEAFKSEEDFENALAGTRLTVEQKKDFRDEWLGKREPDWAEEDRIYKLILAKDADTPEQEVWATQELIETRIHPARRGKMRQALAASVQEGVSVKPMMDYAESLISEAVKYEEGKGESSAWWNDEEGAVDGVEKVKAKARMTDAAQLFIATNPDAKRSDVEAFLEGKGFTKPKTKEAVIEEEDEELAPVDQVSRAMKYLFGK